MRERQRGFDCPIVLFKGGGCYFWDHRPIQGSSVDLVPHRMEVRDRTREMLQTSIVCLRSAIRLDRNDTSIYLLMFALRVLAWLSCQSLITITGV